MPFFFQDSQRTIKINGNAFAIQPYSDNAAAAVARCAEKLQLVANSKIDESQAQKTATVCGIVADLVGELLGKEAYTVIFAGREASFQDHVDVQTYLVAYCTACREARILDAREQAIADAQAAAGTE